MSPNSLKEKMIFVSMTDTAGGAENVLLTMARSTQRPIIFLKKVTRFSLPLSESQKVSYVTSRSLLVGFILLFKELRKYRKGYIILSTHPYLNAYLGILKGIGFLRSDLIVRECTSVFTRFKGFKKLSYQLMYRLGYPFVKLIICQTAIMRKQLLDHNRFIPDCKTIVIANPVDVDLIQQKAREIVCDNDLNGDFICSAGRLIPLKGFSILIKAFSRISLIYPNLKLLILGEGKERKNLDSLILSLGLEERVILKGHISNPSPYFSKARLCVVSSIQEGFPNVLLEMMAVNKNVISTLCAGGIESIPTIIKVDANDVNALTEALKVGLTKERTSTSDKSCTYLINRTPQFFLESVYKGVKRGSAVPVTP